MPLAQLKTKRDISGEYNRSRSRSSPLSWYQSEKERHDDLQSAGP
jgi:hypothetical protein